MTNGGKTKHNILFVLKYPSSDLFLPRGLILFLLCFFSCFLFSTFPWVLSFQRFLNSFLKFSFLFIQILRRKSPYGGHEREELGLPDVRASLGRHRELHPRHEPPGLKT
jgi:hypothetical protein